nr:LCP family protein [Eggerthella guodeyinii]
MNDALLDNDPQKVVDEAEKLTGVEIPCYMMITFASFEALIDAMGGIVVDVPKDIKVPDPMTAEDVTVKAGDDQYLDGSEALVLARARKEYDDNQEALRQINVRNLEIAMLQKVLDLDSEKAANVVLVDLEENTSTIWTWPALRRRSLQGDLSGFGVWDAGRGVQRWRP